MRRDIFVWLRGWIASGDPGGFIRVSSRLPGARRGSRSLSASLGNCQPELIGWRCRLDSAVCGSNSCPPIRPRGKYWAHPDDTGCEKVRVRISPHACGFIFIYLVEGRKELSLCGDRRRLRQAQGRLSAVGTAPPGGCGVRLFNARGTEGWHAASGEYEFHPSPRSPGEARDRAPLLPVRPHPILSNLSSLLWCSRRG
jgi:hypothetical protein